jgi:hypothetical protein
MVAPRRSASLPSLKAKAKTQKALDQKARAQKAKAQKALLAQKATKPVVAAIACRMKRCEDDLTAALAETQ